jgi:hypothetical protein
MMFTRATIRNLGRAGRHAALAAGLLGLGSCADYHLTVPDSDPFTPRGQESAYKTYDTNAFLWGLVLDPQVLPADCQGQGINDVFVHRNFGQDLAGVLTLGLWMPAEISYQCHAPPTTGGTIPVPPSQ